MTDDRMSLGLITEMLDMLDRHGYVRGDNEHTGRAILLISDLAHIYEGSLDHPFGRYINEIPPSRTEPAPPEPASQDAVLIPSGDVKTLLVALYISRRLPTRPRRTLRRLHRPNLPDLRVTSLGRPGV